MNFAFRPVVLPVWQVIVLSIISAAAGTVLINNFGSTTRKRIIISKNENEIRTNSQGKNEITSNEHPDTDKSKASEDENEDESDDESCEVKGDVPIIDSYGTMSGPFKMVLVVNMSLQMGKGKIAAQCGHAALGAYRIAAEKCPSAIRWWLRMGQAKIAVKCDDDKQLEEIAIKARGAGLVCCQIEDAGRTQIAAGSRTVLAIGPAPVSSFKGITEHLKLL
jgi:peptidyl-tRNA hydrolase, PTH2 family